MTNEAGLFLASHLGELNVIDDEHEKVTVALASIAAVYPEINETNLLMFLSQIEISDNIKLAAVSYFCGAEILDVQCDCHDEICDLEFYNKDFWWNRGAQDKLDNSSSYTSTVNWIQSLKNKLS